MKYLRELQELKGVKVLLRVDFNVPVEETAAGTRVVDDFRIRAILPTLQLLKDRGAKAILVSHIEKDGDPSLEPVATHAQKFFAEKGISLRFVKNWRNAQKEIEGLQDGECILLENIRLNEGEKKNDVKFAKELASLADIYVNEAFSVSHREHASVSAVTKFIPSYAGLLLEKEINNLSTAFSPDRPFLFILGGAKFDTKLPLIQKFMKIADKVFVGGALAHNFFKEKGLALGTSLVSPENFNLGDYLKDPKLTLPTDAIAKDSKGEGSIIAVEKVAENQSILDAGPETIEALRKLINSSKYILWNGPLGSYEDGYVEPTHELARMLALATKKGAKTILGGGDTLAAIAELGTESDYTFVSSGGGAMLDYLANETLPGIDALNTSKE